MLDAQHNRLNPVKSKVCFGYVWYLKYPRSSGALLHCRPQTMRLHQVHGSLSFVTGADGCVVTDPRGRLRNIHLSLYIYICVLDMYMMILHMYIYIYIQLYSHTFTM
jgi:hypothetical protein